MNQTDSSSPIVTQDSQGLLSHHTGSDIQTQDEEVIEVEPPKETDPFRDVSCNLDDIEVDPDGAYLVQKI